MGVATIRVSWELFLEAFHLPENTQLIGSNGYPINAIELIVSHPDLKDGVATPQLARQDPVVFVGWGQ